MYPLNTVIVGCPEFLVPHIRRELLNLSVEVENEFASVNQALAELHVLDDQKRLFIVHIKTPEDFDHLGRLGGAFFGCPILALMEGDAALPSVLHAMRIGASQVVLLPIVPDDFKLAVERIGVQFGFTFENATVIAVSGATGGCGATMLALNLAAEIAHLKQLSTLLVELPLQLGMMSTYLDLNPRYTSFDVIRDIEQMDMLTIKRVVTSVDRNLEVLPAPDRAVGGHAFSARELARLIDICRRVAKVVVYEIPCTYDEAFFETIESANQIVLVGQQNLPSIRNLKMLRDTIANDDSSKRVKLVINRFHPKMDGFLLKNLKELLLQRKSDRLADDILLTVANDHATVNAAINHGYTIRKENPNCKVLLDIDNLVGRLLKFDHVPVETPGGGVMNRLIKAFGLS